MDLPPICMSSKGILGCLRLDVRFGGRGEFMVQYFGVCRGVITHGLSNVMSGVLSLSSVVRVVDGVCGMLWRNCNALHTTHLYGIKKILIFNEI